MINLIFSFNFTAFYISPKTLIKKQKIYLNLDKGKIGF